MLHSPSWLPPTGLQLDPGKEFHGAWEPSLPLFFCLFASQAGADTPCLSGRTQGGAWPPNRSKSIQWGPAALGGLRGLSPPALSALSMCPGRLAGCHEAALSGLFPAPWGWDATEVWQLLLGATQLSLPLSLPAGCLPREGLAHPFPESLALSRAVGSGESFLGLLAASFPILQSRSSGRASSGMCAQHSVALPFPLLQDR